MTMPLQGIGRRFESCRAHIILTQEKNLRRPGFEPESQPWQGRILTVELPPQITGGFQSVFIKVTSYPASNLLTKATVLSKKKTEYISTSKQITFFMKKLTTLVITSLALTACDASEKAYCESDYWKLLYQPDEKETVPVAIHTYADDKYATEEGETMIEEQIVELNDTLENNMLYQGKVLASANLVFEVEEWQKHYSPCNEYAEALNQMFNVHYCAEISGEQTIAGVAETGSAIAVVGNATFKEYARLIAKSLGLDELYCDKNECNQDAETLFTKDEVATMRCNLSESEIIPSTYNGLEFLLD